MSPTLRKEFTNRAALVDYLRAHFPAADPTGTISEPSLKQWPTGSRSAGLARLQPMALSRYKSTRNYLNGAVTRLSAYLRHGLLSLAEVRNYALQNSQSQAEVEKFINELGWRDYYQRVYAKIGRGVWKDRELYKTGWTAEDYNELLPADLTSGTTGLACIDSFRHELLHTGYLHNHARLWVAAYVIHWRRVRWQAGARWFLTHLLDGDPASNNLSWQWVASTASDKPYIFNRENLDRYTAGHFCRTCPAKDRCPFDDTYETLTITLFPNR